VSLHIALIVLFACAYKTITAKKAQDYKNVLFIIADDLGWADIGYFDAQVLTPNIDKLARNGIIMNQTYAYPLCTPSRSAFLTGVYSERTGLQHSVILPEQAAGLPPSFTILPEVFKQFGYQTHAVGKWHLGFCNSKYLPVYRGFDTFYGYFNAQNDYLTHRVQGDLIFGQQEGLDYWDATSETLDPILDKNGTYSMFSYTERAIKILESHDKERPFFMYFASQNVHSPLEVPQKYSDMFPNVSDPQRKIFLGMLAVLDEAVGNLTTTLQRLGYLDNTLIVFTSDNGGATYASGRNFPLRGGKMTVFEGGTRVRAFVNGPGVKPYVNEGMFHAVDWMPTILNGAIGVPVEVKGIDGMNQWDAITQNLPSKRTSFVYNIDPIGTIGCPQKTEAIRDGDWKLIRGCPGQFTDWYPVPKFDAQFVKNQYREDIYPKDLAAKNTTVFLFNIKGKIIYFKNLLDICVLILKMIHLRKMTYQTNIQKL